MNILPYSPFRKLKGASSRSTNVRKLKGEEKMPQMNEKRRIYNKKGCAKIRGKGNLRVWEIRGAKSKGAKFKGA